MVVLGRSRPRVCRPGGLSPCPILIAEGFEASRGSIVKIRHTTLKYRSRAAPLLGIDEREVL